MAHQVASGWCGGCSKTDVGELVMPNGAAAYYCKDCTFQRAKDGKFDGTALKGICTSCEDETDTYCSGCSECEESHGSCWSCGDDGELYCTSCRSGDNSSCSRCGEGTSYGYCESCLNCRECGINIVDQGGGTCVSCNTDNEKTPQIPFVIGDDGNANVNGMEVRWS